MYLKSHKSTRRSPPHLPVNCPFVNTSLKALHLPSIANIRSIQLCHSILLPLAEIPHLLQPMAPTSKPVAKRGRPAFKPPRPATRPTKNKMSTTHRKSARAKENLIKTSAEDNEDDDDDDDDDDEVVSASSAEASASEDPDPLAATEPIGTQDPPPTIPPALLTRLLHHHLQDNGCRIGKDANGVIGKYMETFVREAIARAAFERSEAGRTGINGRFLEVSRLYVWEDYLC